MLCQLYAAIHATSPCAPPSFLPVPDAPCPIITIAGKQYEFIFKGCISAYASSSANSSLKTRTQTSFLNSNIALVKYALLHGHLINSVLDGISLQVRTILLWICWVRKGWTWIHCGKCSIHRYLFHYWAFVALYFVITSSTCCPYASMVLLCLPISLKTLHSYTSISTLFSNSD